MKRAGGTAVSPSAAVGLRPFFVRLAFVIAVLGVPILGTGYLFVSKISSDIAIATTERESLAAYGRVASLFTTIAALSGDARAHTVAQHARDEVERNVVLVERAYRDRPLPADARAHWNAWRAMWSAQKSGTARVRVGDLLDGLRDLGSELEYDSPLDYDPNYAIQNLAAAILRQEPRFIAALQRTADAIGAAPGPRLDRHAIEAIATGRALEVQPLALNANDIGTALSLEPNLAASLRPLLQRSARATDAYRHEVAVVLRDAYAGARAVGSVDTQARRTLDAHERLWLRSREQADALILRRLDEEVRRRRVVVALSLVAVFLGTVGIVLIGRNMAHRDRVEVASAKLEADKLRAELSQVATERALRLQELQFRTVFENADVGIVIFDRTGAIAQCNPAAARLLRASSQDVLSDKDSALARFASAERAPYTLEKRCAGDDGAAEWLALTYSGAYLEGVFQLIILLMRDTTEEKTLQMRLLHDASHDTLTRIGNRAAFEADLRAQLERARLGERFALMYIDLDSFKPINDTHGHAAGDRVLIATAQRLQASIASDDSCARIGGDEFAVVLRGTGERHDIDAIARRVRTAIAKPVAFGDTALFVTASVGIALGCGAYASVDEIQLDADRALYAVKEHGRNGHHIIDRFAVRTTPSAT